MPGIEARVAYGYDLNEGKRADRTESHWDFKRIGVWFPMLEWEASKAQAFGYFVQHGIKPPRVYDHFNHANCLPCKNFRQPDWIALRYHYPEKFAEAVAFEAETGLRWMQDADAPLLVNLPMADEAPTRKGRRKLIASAPEFSFDMGCDRCAID